MSPMIMYVCTNILDLLLITKLSVQANPDYKGVCHVALAQEGHCRPGEVTDQIFLCPRADNVIIYDMTSQLIIAMSITFVSSIGDFH